MKIIEVDIKDRSSQEIEEIERLKTIIERAVVRWENFGRRYSNDSKRNNHKKAHIISTNLS
jgi:hypothetical protein